MSREYRDLADEILFENFMIEIPDNRLEGERRRKKNSLRFERWKNLFAGKKELVKNLMIRRYYDWDWGKFDTNEECLSWLIQELGGLRNLESLK